MSMRLRLLAGAAAGLCVATATVAAPLRDDLSGLVSSHPLIKSGEAQVSAADKNVSAALGPLLPTFDLAGGAGYERTESPSFAATPGGKFSEEAENYSATLKQNIWDGGSRWSGRESAKIQKEIAKSGLTNTRQTVLLEGIVAT